MNVSNRKTILLAEDEALIAIYEKAILESYGYVVITAAAGEEAVAAMETTPGIDLVLMDINLGSGMTGTDAAVKILETHDVPLIFISSHTEPEVVKKMEGITSYGYIVKDSGETVLITSIKMAFRLFEAKMNEKRMYEEIIKERKKAENKLKFSEEKFLKAFMTSPVSMDITRLSDLKIIEVNDTFLKTSGYTREEIIGYTPGELMLWESAADREESTNILLNEGKIIARECRFRMKDGSIRTGEYSGFIITIGEEKHVLVWILDVTDRKRAEERVRALLDEKELLLREVHHRIKNNMSTIMSLLSIQASTVRNPEAAAALRDATARVQSMIMLYNKLNKSPSMREMQIGAYLPALMDDIVSLFPGGSSVKVEKHIGDFALDVKILMPLGITVNELITNAMKYAFPGGEGGTITVSASKLGKTVSLTVEDNGAGLPDNFDIGSQEGFGLRLVAMLVRQIGGAIRAEQSAGARFVIEFDVESIEN